MDRLLERYGSRSVLGGLNYVESTLDGEGRIVQTSPMQEIIFGELDPVNEEAAGQLVRALANCGFKTTRSGDIRRDMWEKYIFLTVLSAMTSAVRKPVGGILADGEASRFMREILDEMILLARAEGISLPGDIRARTWARFESVPPAMTSSMSRDLARGLPLELDSLQGCAVRLGEKHRIPVPCLRSVFALLHPYRHGQAQA